MTRITSLPFRQAQRHRVVVSSWKSVVNGISNNLESELVHWDYNVDLNLARSLEISEADFRVDCGLPTSADLCAIVTWRSSASNVRGKSPAVAIGNSQTPRQIALRTEIQGSQLAGTVRVATQIVLARSLDVGPGPVARTPGSVLWEDTVDIALEGGASRFPMEVVDFNTTHWAPYGASWFLSWNSDDLHLPFLRNVRLFINSAHSQVVAAVGAGLPSAEHALIRSAIYYDVGRQLLRGALQNDEFVESAGAYEEGSTGRAIFGMIRTFFSTDNPRGLRSALQERPEHLDSTLQSSLRLFAISE